MLTAKELEKKIRREAELQWKRILAYYMMEAYVTKAQAQAEAELRNAFLATSRYVEEHGLLNRLLERKGDGPSPAELLAEIGKIEPPDSPLGELWTEMQKAPPSEEKLNKALTRVIVEEPPRMIEAAQKEQERRTEWERSHAKEIEAAGDFELVDEEKLRYEERLAKKMALFQVILPPEVYKELEQETSERAAAAGAAAREEGEKFLARMAKDPAVKATGSGLMYKVIKEGTGKKPKATDKVYCHYEGTFPNGQIFDSSYKRGEPAVFGLNQVIKGWTEGLQLMAEGAKYELYLPYHLAYGENGAGGAIPPYSALKFVVELLEVL